MNTGNEITNQTIRQRSIDLISKINSTRYGSPAYTRLTDTFRALMFPKIPELAIDINPQKTMSRVQALNEEATQLNTAPKQSKLLSLFFKPKEPVPVDIAVLQKFYRSNYKVVLKLLDETTYIHFSFIAHRKDLDDVMQFTDKLRYYLLSLSEELQKNQLEPRIKEELEEIIHSKTQDLEEYILVVQNAYFVNNNLIQIYDNIANMLYDMRKKMQETLNYQTTMENKINAIEDSVNELRKDN